MPKDALGHGSNPHGGGNIAGGHLPVWYHGSPTGFPGATGPVHLGTKKAAKEALEARIGIPADGQGWTGNREYGKTLIAGSDTLDRLAAQGYHDGYPRSGYNAGSANQPIPKEDYYPKPGSASFGDGKNGASGTKVPMDAKPAVRAYQITGSMSNHPGIPYSDAKANGFAKAQQTRGYSKNGFYYKNIGEDSGSVSAVVPSRNHLTGQMG
jgi:hypothetical protein